MINVHIIVKVEDIKSIQEIENLGFNIEIINVEEE